VANVDAGNGLRDDVARPTTLSSAAPVGPLLERLGYVFETPSLFDLALSHRSWCAENAGHDSNERLEFLGDAVLSIVVTEHLYAAYPDLPEGELAKARAAVVSATSLAEVATELGLGEVLRLGKGEHRSGGRRKRSILADGLEAIFGAVYLDGGLDAARVLVLELVAPRLVDATAGPGGNDHKTRLQELAARAFDETPVYVLTESGPDHDKRFSATVRLDGAIRGEGVGRSKKEAEQAAARAAWDRLVIELADDDVVHVDAAQPKRSMDA